MERTLNQKNAKKLFKIKINITNGSKPVWIYLFFLVR